MSQDVACLWTPDQGYSGLQGDILKFMNSRVEMCHEF